MQCAVDLSIPGASIYNTPLIASWGKTGKLNQSQDKGTYLRSLFEVIIKEKIKKGYCPTSINGQDYEFQAFGTTDSLSLLFEKGILNSRDSFEPIQLAVVNFEFIPDEDNLTMVNPHW